MYNQFIFKIVAPTILTSAMLVIFGVVAASNIQRQQKNSSDLIQQEVHGMIAAQDLCNDIREIRHELHQYRQDGALQHLEAIQRRGELTPVHLASAKELIQMPREAEAVAAIEKRWQQFVSRFEEFKRDHISGGEAMQKRLQEHSIRISLTDPLLTDITQVLVPAKDYLALDRMLVEKTNETNRKTTETVRQTLLWLGVCGGIAGMIGGIVIARSLGQSVVQLDVSVRGAVDRLQDVVGPVKISQRNGFRELEAGLQQVENHIATVVERLRQRELEVLRSDQLAAVGQLAAGVAHELRNPLMPMKMLVQASMERDDGCGLCGDQLLVVEEEIQRMEKSIQDFLDFARPPSIEITRFDLRTAIEQIMELVAVRADQQRVELVDSLPEQPVVIEADVAQIRQVLLNLLLNAIDALREGGRIDVEVVRGVDPEDSSVRSGKWVGIFVRDTGPGLAAEVLDRVFEPFVSTKETGTGLGLSICRRIVNAHNGVIRAVNQPGRGAEFAVYLPSAANSHGDVEKLALLAEG